MPKNVLFYQLAHRNKVFFLDANLIIKNANFGMFNTETVFKKYFLARRILKKPPALILK
jgi:hypothetical protein